MNEAPSFLRIVSRWLLGAILAAVVAGLFLAIVAVQLTSAGTGQRILRRAVAVMIDIDAILPNIQTSLRQAAKDSPAARVTVPNFPIPVELPRDEALQIEGGELRDRLLGEAAHRLYQDGMSAWAADPAADQDIEAISTVGALHRGLGLITEANHRGIVIAASVVGFLAVVLALMLLATVRSYARFLVLGITVVAAALPSLAAAIAFRFVLRTAEEEADPFVTGLSKLGVDAMWVPIRDYLVLSALGFGVIALGAVLLWWQARRGGLNYSRPSGGTGGCSMSSRRIRGL